MPASRRLRLAVALMLAHLAASAAEAQTVQRGSQDLAAAASPVTFASPIPGAAVSSGFGLRRHPILGVMMRHEGIDLAAPQGTPILAAAGGVVLETGYEAGYGSFVRVGHAQGLETLYGHMSRIATSRGALVSSGEVIGHVGSTGLATGPHLHFEVRKGGAPVDPAGSLRAPPLRIAASRGRPTVEVLRGGQGAAATGGPGSAAVAGVQVVRGGRASGALSEVRTRR